MRSPLAACMAEPASPGCAALLGMKNPYYLGDEVGLTQTLGWVDAWTSWPSVYAVAARSTHDVVAAVNFARENNLRLVVKGGGHSYQGTSNAADSLLIWTRGMNAITLHDAFVGAGLRASARAGSARSRSSAGAIWAQVYDAVTTQGGPLRAGRRLPDRRRRRPDPERRLRQLLESATAWRRRACWRPRSSPPTARCGSPMPAPTPICSGRSRAAAAAASAS